MAAHWAMILPRQATAYTAVLFMQIVPLDTKKAVSSQINSLTRVQANPVTNIQMNPIANVQVSSYASLVAPYAPNSGHTDLYNLKPTQLNTFSKPFIDKG